MKLVIAIIQDYDTNAFLTQLASSGIMATRIASAGGFLRQGNTTAFSAVEDDQVALVKRILARTCGNRVEHWPDADISYLEDESEHVAATRIGGGIGFVARISHFEKMPGVGITPGV